MGVTASCHPQDVGQPKTLATRTRYRPGMPAPADDWQTPIDRYARPRLTWETCERINVQYSNGLKGLIIPRWHVPGGIRVELVERERWRGSSRWFARSRSNVERSGSH